jgi:hypothetical protein
MGFWWKTDASRKAIVLVVGIVEECLQFDYMVFCFDAFDYNL